LASKKNYKRDRGFFSKYLAIIELEGESKWGVKVEKLRTGHFYPYQLPYFMLAYRLIQNHPDWWWQAKAHEGHSSALQRWDSALKENKRRDRRSFMAFVQLATASSQLRSCSVITRIVRSVWPSWAMIGARFVDLCQNVAGSVWRQPTPSLPHLSTVSCTAY